MNTAEKISVLETLLVRVQQRAAQARPPRSNNVVVEEPLQLAPPAIAEPAVVAAPPATAAVEPATEVTTVAAAVEEPAPEPRKSAPVATPAPVMTRTSSGSYVAKGGMSEELPDFDLEEEEEQGEEEIILEQSAPAASEDDREAEEFAIPLRPSVQMRAIVAPTPIEVSSDDSELEIDHAPLASALPASTEEAIALQARRIPSSSVPAVPGGFDIDVSPASLSAPPIESSSAPQFNTPAVSQLDEPEETLVSNVISLPEERDEETAIPLVAAIAKAEPVAEAPAIVPPAVVPAPTAAPTPAAPIAAPLVAKPALVPAPTSAVAPAPAAKVTEPVVHEAPPIAEAQAIEIVAEIPAPTAPLTFGALLRRSLGLRVK